jgi:DNA-binding transcriptional regulator GbsR (MarR family)
MQDKALLSAQDRFVLQWGRLSQSWGINRTMAQIHALLLSSDEPLSVDDLIERLQISRGNASMNLRDLMEWGIVQRFRRPGERKDLYQASGDLYSMFARVVRERKRRELDPAVAAIRECLSLVPTDESSQEAVAFRERLSTLLSVFGMIDRVYDQVFASDETFRRMVTMFEDQED